MENLPYIGLHESQEFVNEDCFLIPIPSFLKPNANLRCCQKISSLFPKKKCLVEKLPEATN